MSSSDFSIELKDIHWVDGLDEDEYELDLCAHGKVLIKIGNEIVADNTETNYDCALTATALHLLRSLEADHTEKHPVGERLVPGEGHFFIPIEDNSVYIVTAYPNVKGWNWWVIHENNKVKLITESKKETIIPFEIYKNQVIQFVDKIDAFYKISKPKVLPDDNDDREAYLRLRREWKAIRENYT